MTTRSRRLPLLGTATAAFLVAALLGPAPVSAQVPATPHLPAVEAWKSAHDPLSLPTVVTAADGLVFTGASANDRSGVANSDLQAIVVASDAATGAQVWETAYDYGENWDLPRALEVSPDGRLVYLLAFSKNGPDNLDFATLALDVATGDIVWEARYDETQPEDASPRKENPGDLAVSSDGRFLYAMGSADTGTYGENDFLVVAYDAATGAQLWTFRHGGGLYRTARAMDIAPDGSALFVTGGTWYGGSGRHLDYTTVGVDAATGQLLWERDYDGPAQAMDEAVDIGVNPNGDLVYVTGESYSGWHNWLDYLTFAYDTKTGAVVWGHRWSQPDQRHDYATGLAVAPDGSAVYVTGGIITGSIDYHDTVTIAYDGATGEMRWLTQYNSGPKSMDVPFDIVTSPSGHLVYVTGDMTLAYDAVIGKIVWVGRHGPAIAADPDGSRVYVVSRDKAGYDQTGEPYLSKGVTVAYCALPLAVLGSCAQNLP